jgi:ribosomal protein S6
MAMDEINLKTYEISFLLEDESGADFIYENLNKYKAQILEHKDPVRINLAYPVKKQKSAFFGYVDFEMNPNDLLNFEKKIKQKNKVLRFMIISNPSTKKATTSFSKKPETILEKPKTEEIFLTNEDLSKKIEEML